MVTIEFERNGQVGSKRVHTFALESTIRNFKAAGYTIISDGNAPVAPVAPVEEETTGRVGKGKEVHRIVGGGADCGTSYRRGTNREVKVTGEEITCRSCRAL